MSNYNKSTNFAVKDTLTSGDPEKVVSGAEIDNEFNSIVSAVTSKADKVAAATTDNFASLDASGNLKDSGASQNSIETFVQTEISDQKYKDQDALDLFNVTGSAPVYACRAWVNFDGTGTVSIRESGNVSSITDNGTGDYTVNLTTAMPDANGSVTYGGIRDTGSLGSLSFHQQLFFTSTSSVRVRTGTAGSGLDDHEIVSIALFR